MTSVVGLQWGDEAKGKIVDFLTDSHEVVVRYQGGNNAGHTVKFDGQTYKLSLLPTGILRPGVKAVIGNGLVVNPEALLKEMKSLTDRGVQVDGQNLLLSDRAHVILPYHIVEDAVFEKRRGNQAIGTTGRGIGTCYRDKAGRTHAIRVGDLYHPETFRTKLADIVAFKNLTLKALDSTLEPLNADAIYESYMGYAEQLKSHVVDTTAWLHRALKEKKNILFEGAQGSLLDVDHGTFPYVTSSNSSSAGIHSGSGVPQRAITRMIGIAKAYTTRVGGGPFPTELNNEIGQHIRDVGHEYGTVTGRPRRCGWFDAVATGYGARICGVDEIAVMLLDVLAQLDGRTPVQRRRVGLKALDRVPVREHTVLQSVDGNVVGEVTSGLLGPSIDQPIAMAYVDTAQAKVGQQLNAIVRGKSVPMAVVAMPFVPNRYHRGPK